MKNVILSFLASMLMVCSVWGQVPQAFKYQTVVRDANGQILANQAVTIGVDLIQNSNAIYAEDHNAMTNDFGLVNLEIGRGDVVLNGVFNQIDWSVPTSITLLLDPTGGTNLQNIGTSELLTVPYAMHALNGGGSGLPANAQTGDIVYYDGSAWQRLPAGAVGTVLTMGADGLPAWQALSSPLDSLLKVTMTNGDVIYVSPVVNNAGVQWATFGNTNITALPDITTVAAVNMDFSGEANTDAIVAQLGANGGTAYAAKVCADLVAYGFDDWYLPAAGELNEMYLKLGPVANGGNGQITTGVYWSSSEYGDFAAWFQVFAVGIQNFNFKTDVYQCRCVRR